MKYYIKSSSSTEDLYVDIRLEYIEYSGDVAASTKMLNYGTEWNNFIDDVVGLVEAYNFDVVHKQPSHSKNSESYYLSFYPCDKDNQPLTKYLIHLRISKHVYPGKIDHSNKYFEKLSNENNKSGRKKQLFKLQQIIIGGHVFSNTDEALNYIEYMCDSLQQGRSDLSNMLSEFSNHS